MALLFRKRTCAPVWGGIRVQNIFCPSGAQVRSLNLSYQTAGLEVSNLLPGSFSCQLSTAHPQQQGRKQACNGADEQRVAHGGWISGSA